MTVNLYSCTSAPNTLYKSKTLAGSAITAHIKGSCDIERPSLILDWKGVDFNYVEISTWNRYYYVTGITALPGDMTQISLQSDPVESVAAQIYALPALAVRNEDINKWDKNEPDPDMITKSKHITKGYSFGSMQDVHTNADATYIIGVV